MRGLFRFPSRAKKPEAEAVGRVKGWVREALALPPEAALAVNEIICPDPSCPGLETVILVMRPGEKTRAHKVSKPLDAVTEPDVRAALVG